jgi:hypothetical protein
LAKTGIVVRQETKSQEKDIPGVIHTSTYALIGCPVATKSFKRFTATTKCQDYDSIFQQIEIFFEIEYSQV